MAQVLYDNLAACADCAVAIANDDYSGMSDAHENRTRDEINEWSRKGYLVVGDELGFTHRGCDICRDGLAGDKHQISILSV